MSQTQPETQDDIHPDYDSEREGLLSGKEGYDQERDSSGYKDVSRKRVYTLAGILALFMLGAVFVPPYFKTARRPVADFDSQKLRSNGTHEFRKTSLIVSIDGLRLVFPYLNPF